MPETIDQKYMEIALRLAAKARGRTSPNPMVGAVIVKEGRIIAQGHHQKAGEPHAEVNALEAAREDPQGSTLYVSLEPCNHHGRTPPCTKAILAAGVSRVVVGMRDPNPEVTGGGIDFLRAHGVSVECGTKESECRSLNEAFITYVEKKRPFVIMKAAASLDGKIATACGDAKWITGEKSRHLVHRLRNEVDAILVGIGTVLKDDPMLTTRLGPRAGRDPVRVILDSRLRTPLTAQILNLDSPAPTIIAISQDVPERKKKPFLSKGIELMPLPAGNNGLSLQEVLTRLAKRGIVSLLLEGGGTVFASFLECRLIDKHYFFYAPIIIGGQAAPGVVQGTGARVIADAWRVGNVRIKKIGGDFLVEAYPQRSGVVDE